MRTQLLFVLCLATGILACNPNRLVTKGRKHIKGYEGEYVYLQRDGYEDYYFQEPCHFFKERLHVYHDTENKKAWYIKEVKKEGTQTYFVNNAKTIDREAVMQFGKEGETMQSARFYKNRAKQGTFALALGEVEYGNETYVTPVQNPANLEKRYCYDFNAIFSEYPKQWTQVVQQDTNWVRLEECKTKAVEEYTFGLPKEGCKDCKPQLTIKSQGMTYNVLAGVKENGKIAVNYSENGKVRNFKLDYHPQKSKLATVYFAPASASAKADTAYFVPTEKAGNYPLVKEECD